MSEKTLNEVKYKEALEAMEKGDEKAKTIVAYHKLTGLGGVEKDVKGAVVLLEERVKDKDPEAEWMLGLCYEYGMGIEQDIAHAILLYRQSRKKGNVIGKFLLECGGRGEGRGSGVMYASYCL